MPPVPPGKPLVAFIPGRTGVIQGSFIGGKPRVLMPAAPPAPATVQRKIATIPTAGATTRGPGLTSPRIPPTLPATGRGSLVQASTDNSFRLPDTVVLRPPGVGQRLPDGVRSQMEAVFHADFSDVRVLVGHEAHRSVPWRSPMARTSTSPPAGMLPRRHKAGSCWATS